MSDGFFSAPCGDGAGFSSDWASGAGGCSPVGFGSSTFGGSTFGFGLFKIDHEVLSNDLN
jgi:hypothetical protein